MRDCNPLKVILDQVECMSEEEEKNLMKAKENGEEVDPATIKAAQKATGELLWLATRTRVDLCYTIHRMCCMTLSNPRVLRMQKKGVAIFGWNIRCRDSVCNRDFHENHG